MNGTPGEISVLWMSFGQEGGEDFMNKPPNGIVSMPSSSPVIRNTSVALTLLPLALLVVYVFMTPPLADDIWWRLHSGRHMLTTGEVPSVNGFAYRDTQQAWVNHAAGYDAILAVVHRVAGLPAVVWLHLFAFFGLGFTLLRNLSVRDLGWALWVPPLLAIHYALRPYVFSDLLLFFTVRHAWRLRFLPDLKRGDCWVPGFLFFLWGQLHGAVWIGVVSFILFATDWSRLFQKPAAEIRRIGPVGLLVFLVSLANVNHVHGLVLAVRYATGGFPWLGELTEWQAPGYAHLLVLGAFAGGWVHAWHARNRQFFAIWPMVPFGVLAFLQVRHLPLFVVVAVALWSEQGPQVATVRKDHRFPSGLWSRIHSHEWIFALGFALVASVILAPRTPEPRFYPLGLYRRMEICDTAGPLRVFTLHAWGGAQLFHFQGRLAPFLDARNDCFSRETFTRYLHITRLKEGWYDLLMEDDPDGAALPVAHPLAVALRQKGWIPGARSGRHRFLVAPRVGRALCRRFP